MKDLNLMVFMVQGGMIYLEDLESKEIMEAFKAPRGVYTFFSVYSKPILFCLRENGHIDAFVALNGTLINSFGPFTNVVQCYFDEENEKLLVLDINFCIRITNCNFIRRNFILTYPKLLSITLKLLKFYNFSGIK